MNINLAWVSVRSCRCFRILLFFLSHFHSHLLSRPFAFCSCCFSVRLFVLAHTLSTVEYWWNRTFSDGSCANPPFNTHFIFKKEFDISVTMCLKFLQWNDVSVYFSKDPTANNSGATNKNGERKTTNWMRLVIGLEWTRAYHSAKWMSSLFCVCERDFEIRAFFASCVQSISRNVINFIEFGVARPRDTLNMCLWFEDIRCDYYIDSDEYCVSQFSLLHGPGQKQYYIGGAPRYAHNKEKTQTLVYYLTILIILTIISCGDPFVDDNFWAWESIEISGIIFVVDESDGKIVLDENSGLWKWRRQHRQARKWEREEGMKRNLL